MQSIQWLIPCAIARASRTLISPEWPDVLIKAAAVLAREAIQAVAPRAMNAARIIVFKGILHLLSGEVSGFDGGRGWSLFAIR